MPETDIRIEAAGLMEQRAQAAQRSDSERWINDDHEVYIGGTAGEQWVAESCDPEDMARSNAIAAHIAAADPTFMLAVAAGLRESVERHAEVPVDFFADPLDLTVPTMCQNCRESWPCPDAAAWNAVAEACMRDGGAE